MNRRLVLVSLAAGLSGVSAAHAQSEWRACAYLGAGAFGLLALALFIGGAYLLVVPRRSRP